MMKWTSAGTILAMLAVSAPFFLEFGCAPDCPSGTLAEYEQCVRKGTAHPEATGGDAGSGGRTAPSSGGGGTSGGTDGKGGSSDAGPDRSAGEGGASEAGPGAPDADAADAESPDGDASGGSSCDPGQVLSTGSCITERLFVNAETGVDANDGGPGAPLKTFHAAMLKVRPKQRIQFEQGTWGPLTTGDDFHDAIPDDVVLEAAAPTASVAFAGGGTASLAFAGSAELRDVTIEGFAKPLVASSGSPRAVAITIRNSFGSVWLDGSAKLRCESCTFEEDTTKNMAIVQLTNAARLELVNAHFVRFMYAAAGIDVQGSASILLDGCNFGGGLQNAVHASTSGTITLKDSHFATPTYDIMAGGGVDGPLSIEIEGCTFGAGVQLVAPLGTVRVRNSEMVLLAINGSDQVADLGTPGDAGGNEFVRKGRNFSAPYLWVTGWGNVIHAAGNQWPADQQGTDSSGHYSTPTIIDQGESGPNIEVRDDGTDGAGRAPSRVEL
jgi:hypothetical protein